MLHQHRFDFVAVVQAEQSLDRLFVAGMLHDDRDDVVETEASAASSARNSFGNTVTPATSAINSLVAAR